MVSERTRLCSRIHTRRSHAISFYTAARTRRHRAHVVITQRPAVSSFDETRERVLKRKQRSGEPVFMKVVYISGAAICGAIDTVPSGRPSCHSLRSRVRRETTTGRGLSARLLGPTQRFGELPALQAPLTLVLATRVQDCCERGHLCESKICSVLWKPS